MQSTDGTYSAELYLAVMIGTGILKIKSHQLRKVTQDTCPSRTPQQEWVVALKNVLAKQVVNWKILPSRRPRCTTTWQEMEECGLRYFEGARTHDQGQGDGEFFFIREWWGSTVGSWVLLATRQMTADVIQDSCGAHAHASINYMKLNVLIVFNVLRS